MHLRSEVGEKKEKEERARREREARNCEEQGDPSEFPSCDLAGRGEVTGHSSQRRSAIDIVYTSKIKRLHGTRAYVVVTMSRNN